MDAAGSEATGATLPAVIPGEEDDESKYVSQWRKCGRCHSRFWSEARTVKPFGVPLVCSSCHLADAPRVRAMDAKFRERYRADTARRAGKKIKGKPNEISFDSIAEILLEEKTQK